MLSLFFFKFSGFSKSKKSPLSLREGALSVNLVWERPSIFISLAKKRLYPKKNINNAEEKQKNKPLVAGTASKSPTTETIDHVAIPRDHLHRIHLFILGLARHPPCLLVAMVIAPIKENVICLKQQDISSRQTTSDTSRCFSPSSHDQATGWNIFKEICMRVCACFGLLNDSVPLEEKQAK